MPPSKYLHPLPDAAGVGEDAAGGHEDAGADDGAHDHRHAVQERHLRLELHLLLCLGVTILYFNVLHGYYDEGMLRCQNQNIFIYVSINHFCLEHLRAGQMDEFPLQITELKHQYKSN